MIKEEINILRGLTTKVEDVGSDVLIQLDCIVISNLPHEDLEHFKGQRR